MREESQPTDVIYLDFEEARMARGSLSDLQENEQTLTAGSELSGLVRERRPGRVSVGTAWIASRALEAAAQQSRNNNEWSKRKTLSDRIRRRILRRNSPVS